MLKQVLILFSLACFAKITTLSIRPDKTQPSDVNPFALIDDAVASLTRLNETVIDLILQAQDELSNFAYDVLTDSVDVRLQIQIDITQEYFTDQQSLSDLKILAAAAGVNISACLEDNEDQLLLLPNAAYERVNGCISDLQTEFRTFLSRTFYNVDVSFNVVQLLGAQLQQCADDDDDCINVVVANITDYNSTVPLQIFEQVNLANQQTELTRTEFQLCANEGLADYVEEADGVLATIAQCVEELLS